MRKLLLLLLLSTPILSFPQSSDSKRVFPLLSVDSPPLFGICINNLKLEQKTCFQESINKHISDNLKFPEESFDSKEGGRVFVNITFDKKGSVSNIDVRGPNEILENEVIRVINLLPNLYPAKKNGFDVSVSYALPVDFFLLSQFNYKEITIKEGSTIYESADTKSKPILVTKSETILNGSKAGDFWLTELNIDGSYTGYVYKNDILDINNIIKNDNNLLNIEDKKNDIDESEIIMLNKNPVEVLKEDESKISLTDDPIMDVRPNNSPKIKSKTELNVQTTIIKDYGISGLRKEIITIDRKIDNIPIRNNDKFSKENLVEKNNHNIVSTENLQVGLDDAKEKLKQLTSLYNQNLITKELFDKSSERFNEIIQNNSQIDINEIKEKLKKLTSLYNRDLISKEVFEASAAEFKALLINNSQMDINEAKEKLKKLTSLYNQDLISKEVFEASAAEFKKIIELDKINKITLTEIPNIDGNEALERIKTLKTLYENKLINKETYESSTKILKKIILQD